MPQDAEEQFLCLRKIESAVYYNFNHECKNLIFNVDSEL